MPLLKVRQVSRKNDGGQAAAGPAFGASNGLLEYEAVAAREKSVTEPINVEDETSDFDGTAHQAQLRTER
jgi:hypothetical protein